MKLIVITGMSGSGKTAAMRFFEDHGCFCMDNIPPVLISKLLEMLNGIGAENKKLVLVIDSRVGEMISELLNQLDEIKKQGHQFELLFMDASDEYLVKRYKETRRAHPVKAQGGLMESIKKEREMLSGIFSAADYVLDTSGIKAGDLHKNLEEMFLDDAKEGKIKINVMAFGFKYGMPPDADLVFDVRCFPNPFYVAELKNKTGNDVEVQEYVMNSEESVMFVDKLIDMVSFMLPLYEDEGKTSLTVAIGCTGGKHRSVTMANKLSDALCSLGYEPNRIYRDIEK